MDSLTQIVLGAAVSEVALGRKIGNRALIWGAIGGTIPDLDVLANPFLDDIESLAFHRGITHSIFFSVAAPFLFGTVVHRLYDSKFHKTRLYKTLVIILNVAMLAGITYGLNYLFRHEGHPRWWFLLISVLLAVFLLTRLYQHYIRKDLEEPKTTFREWYWLFFLAFFTHILLDSFTAFGTQVFQPFSNYRLAFNNIAVADPAYTLPFLLCIIVVSTLQRNTRRRRLWNIAGIGISSLYMLLTLVNKVYIDHVIEKAIEHRQLDVSRYRTGPTILNNILWSFVAESPDTFYVGLYSIFDSNPNLHYVNAIPRQDSIHRELSSHEDYQVLQWFSDGYLAAFPHDSVTYLCDLRYGGMSDTIRDQRDLVFNFSVKKENGEYVFAENREPPQGDMGELLRNFWRRIQGY